MTIMAKTHSKADPTLPSTNKTLLYREASQAWNSCSCNNELPVSWTDRSRLGPRWRIVVVSFSILAVSTSNSRSRFVIVADLPCCLLRACASSASAISGLLWASCLVPSSVVLLRASACHSSLCPMLCQYKEGALALIQASE